MAITRSTDASLVKPLEGALTRRYTTSGAIEAGQAVYLNSSGYATLTNAAAVASNFCIGLAVTDIASGARGDFVTFGPLQMCTAATPGAIIYTLDTTSDGEIGETAGTKTCIVGQAESATVVLVNPQMVSLT
jgi:hypothetical protein